MSIDVSFPFIDSIFGSRCRNEISIFICLRYSVKITVNELNRGLFFLRAEYLDMFIRVGFITVILRDYWPTRIDSTI